MYEIQAWQLHQAGQAMRAETLTLPPLTGDQVLIAVAGCGVCHTDLGFRYEGIRTVKPLPLVLGHEISGVVEDTGPDAGDWQGRSVIVPAVLPCGECPLCRKGRGTLCRKQYMPGNHVDGGFASHVVLPARSLCPVDVEDVDAVFGESEVTLRELSVIADAVTTPYQAVHDCGLHEGDFAVFVGVGGIGGFGVQIAKALGATVAAIDLDDRRLARLRDYGADVTFNAGEMDTKAVRMGLREYVDDKMLPPHEWKIFECSGTAAGQRTAFGLLTYGATLGVVGFTMETLDLRLSNLMAFGARAVGNWGCHPDHYPPALKLVEEGKVRLAPFVRRFPLSEINSVFEQVHARELDVRPVLVPDGTER